MSRVPRGAALALALALPLGLAGCIQLGGEELTPACERKSTSPWPAYEPAFLEQVTRVDGAAPAGWPDAVAPHLITTGGAPHARFDAWLANGSFVARGDNDSYFLRIVEEDGRVSARPNHTDPWDVAVPESIRAFAESIVAKSPDAVRALGEAKRVEGATWSRELPSCVALDYGAPDGEAGGKRVIVNVVRGQPLKVETLR